MDFLLSRRQIKGMWAHFKAQVTSQILVNSKQRKQILVGLVVILFLAVGTVSYKYYLSSKRQAALELLQECAELYKNAANSDNKDNKNKAEQWVELEAAAKAGLLKAGLTGYKAYFLMYQAQALQNQNKLPEAQQLIKQALASLSSSSPVYALYTVAYALTLVDNKQVSEALELLKKIADNPKASNRDLVLFYLGEIYNREGQVELAKAAYQALIKDFKIIDKTEYGFNQESAWIRPAEERLTYL